MIAICKHLCRGVDGKGIVRGEKMIHSFAFFFFFYFFFDLLMKAMLQFLFQASCIALFTATLMYQGRIA